MTVRQLVPIPWWRMGVVVLLVSGVIPVVGSLARRDSEPRCTWDGQKIDPLFQVKFVFAEEETYSFCCLWCAESWHARVGLAPTRVLVTDESSRTVIDARRARYVRSRVVVNEVSGEQRHVFLRAEDAEKHRVAASGRELVGTERPFSEYEDATRPNNFRNSNPDLLND